ncbi:hypothetical protein Nmel_008562 [Mimus melanotis]
MSLSPLQEEL